MTGTVVAGFLNVVALSLAPVAVLALLLRTPRLYERLAVRARRRRAARRGPTEPLGPPLEDLAADLRRLRPAVHSPRHGIPMAKHLATVGVYDDRLVATARALGVPTSLAEVPPGMEHEAERMRLEHALEQAGLSWEVHPA